MRFSSDNRTKLLSRLKTESFDLLVIGGGITGCGIALDAASRGLRVALLEKSDFASGTSSKSTKLIHGGLRYLKQLEFGLVKEVGSERAVVHALAPHLVVPEKMLLPLYEKRGLGYWLTSVGLKIYDWLAGVRPEDQRKMLTRQQTLRAEPLLEKHAVRGGALYAEYRTDDARLTIEIAKTAFRHGAVLLNYVVVTGFEHRDGNLSAGWATDLFSSEQVRVNATVIVNAAGPWVDELRKADKSLQGKRLHLSKGVHIVVARERLPVRQAIYFDVAADNRMIFAIPRGRVTYIGTTDTSYHGSSDEVYATVDDARYLIDAVNVTFPKCQLTLRDIESSWAGLRPLIHEEGKSAADLSRKDEIFISPSGLISIAGGKLTGYRKMAERVVNLVIKRSFSGVHLNPVCTAAIRLTPNGPVDLAEVEKMKTSLRQQLAPFGFPHHVGDQLFESFGPAALVILDQFYRQRDGTDDMLALLRAQLHFCIDEEMVFSASDFFVRRTGLLFFDIQLVQLYKDVLLQEMSGLLNWTHTQESFFRDETERLLASAQLRTD